MTVKQIHGSLGFQGGITWTAGHQTGVSRPAGLMTGGPDAILISPSPDIPKSQIHIGVEDFKRGYERFISA